MRVLIVTPAPRGDRGGNRITALRWAGLLRSLGHRVRIAQSYGDQPAELMIALHARKSADSIERFPGRRIVALTGTDIYGELDETIRRSLSLADRIVALQPRAIERLDPSLRSKAVAILQSAPSVPHRAEGMTIAVAGHLRDIKDPFRAAEASRLLPSDSRIAIAQAGAALDPALAERAEREQRENPRYRWLGAISRREVRTLLAKSRALVISSLAEGGANVVSEAIRAGVPILASRIDGTIGQLGEDYPGYFAPKDTESLMRLMLRIEREPDFLLDEVKKRAPLFSRERERELWARTLREMSFHDDVLRGLTAGSKHLACCWFYDDEGSKLFQQICELEEYYIPRAEREILGDRTPEILSLSPPRALIVELGSGDSAKTRMIIDAFHRRDGRARYLPIDISSSALEQSSRALRADFPRLEVDPYVGEYTGAVRYLRERMRDVPKLILFLGSNIGNFDRTDAARFLSSVRGTMGPPDRLLLGIDLRKDRSILEPAYDDPRGVTAEFNLNLLRRINRELGADFDLSAFAHRAEYQEREGRIAMYLESLRRQTVRIGNSEIRFDAGERIHTEYSYKYSDEEIDELASGAGLQIVRRWTDTRRLFGSILLAAQ